jgi:hypothetical protein
MRAHPAKTTLMAGVAVACACAFSAQGATYKCTTPEGKVAYQDSPCPSGATEKSLKLAVPPAPPAAAKPAPVYVAPVPRSMYDAAANPNIPRTIDTRGPLETWDRFAKAFNRGDKNAAMREITPSQQPQYGPVLDQLMPPPGTARR